MSVTVPALIISIVILMQTTNTPKTPDLNLTYLGHSSFELEASGIRVIIDPYHNSPWSHWFDIEYSKRRADILAVSHGHFDHAATQGVDAKSTLETEGILESGPFRVTAVPGLHARPSEYGSENRVLLIDVRGLRFVHWGDNGPEIPSQVLDGPRVDVLFLPIDDSEHILSFADAEGILDRLRPRVVVPMHYFIAGLTSQCSTLRGIESWLDTQENPLALSRATVGISPTSFTGRSSAVWVFPYHPALNPSTSTLPCAARTTGPWIVIAATLAAVLAVALIRRTVSS